MAGVHRLWRPLSGGFTTTLGPPDTHVGAGMALAGGPQGHQEAAPQTPAGGQTGRRVPALPWDAPTRSGQAPGGAGPGTATPLSPDRVGCPVQAAGVAAGAAVLGGLPAALRTHGHTAAATTGGARLLRQCTDRPRKQGLRLDQQRNVERKNKAPIC